MASTIVIKELNRVQNQTGRKLLYSAWIKRTGLGNQIIWFLCSDGAMN